MKINSSRLQFFALPKLAVIAIACALSTHAIAQVPRAPVITAIDGRPVTPQTPPVVPPTTPGTSQVPLSWSDSEFGSMTNAGQLTLGANQVRTNLSISEQSGEPSITCQGSCTLDHVRIQSREGVRCVSGTMSLNWVYVAATGIGSDHADGLQCYSPGSSGSVTVKHATFKMAGATNAGYFSADNWRGTHVLEDVLFWGGNFGLRIPADGGSSVKLKNVYFVKGSFNFGAFLFDVVNGKRIDIQQWENVRWVTIENGTMVLGDAIPKPN